jgi:hypothetical protein
MDIVSYLDLWILDLTYIAFSTSPFWELSLTNRAHYTAIVTAYPSLRYARLSKRSTGPRSTGFHPLVEPPNPT